MNGSCLCGTVRYEIDGPFSMMIHCHCSMCRKHHGAAYATWVAGPLDGFRWIAGSEMIRSYQSSEHGRRSFCPTCGSVTPILHPTMKLALVPAGSLQGELGIEPQAHWFVDSKAPWYEITDSLPQHAAYPPEFNSPGVERPAVKARDGVVEGSCLCGAVGFEVTSQATGMANCYCSRCRRARSAAHASNLFYPLEGFRYVRGEERLVDYQLPEARYFGVAFCDRCGASVARKSADRGLAVVPAGSLDVDPGVRPMMHICVASKASWVQINDATPQFAELPPPPAR